MDVSSRLVVNKAAMKIKHRLVRGLVEELGNFVSRQRSVAA